MTTQQPWCFNVDTGKVCVTSTPIAPTTSENGLVTQGFFGDIGNGISNAASAVSDFFRENALPIGLGLGAAATAALGGGLAYGLSGNGTPTQQGTFSNLPTPTPQRASTSPATLPSNYAISTPTRAQQGISIANLPQNIQYSNVLPQRQQASITNVGPTPFVVTSSTGADAPVAANQRYEVTRVYPLAGGCNRRFLC